MGDTGVGKSMVRYLGHPAGIPFLKACQFVKHAVRAEVKTGDKLTSRTQEIQVIRCHNPAQNSDVLLVDTPGFDDTLKADAEILEQIVRWLKETFEKSSSTSWFAY